MASGIALKETLTQTGHGFAPGQAVRHDGTLYVLAQADTAGHAEVVGIVESVNDDDFTIVECGRMVIPGQSYAPGSVYFLSAETPGGVTTVEPSVIGQISKPVFIATGAIAGVVVQYRGVVIQ